MRYNQYTDPYLQRLTQPDNLVYKPVYDPSIDDKWMQALGDRQQRYDVGRQALAKAQMDIGSLQSYDPEFIDQKLTGFTKSVQDMVDTKYGGDYGLAVNDVSDMIAKERGNKIYKLNDYLNKQAEDQLKFKGKAQDKFITTKDLTQAGLLQQAYDSEDPYSVLAAENFERPDYGNVAASYASKVPANVTNELFKNLKPEDANALGLLTNNGEAFWQEYKLRTPNKNLDNAVDNIARIIYQDNKKIIDNDPQFAGLDDKAKMKKLTSIVSDASDIFKFREEDASIKSMPGRKTAKDLNTSGYNTIPDPGGAPSSEPNLHNEANDKYGKNSFQTDLSNPSHAKKTKPASYTSTSYGTSIETGKPIEVENKEYTKGWKELNEFKGRYGDYGFKSNDPNEQYKQIQFLKDKQNYTFGQVIPVSDETEAKKIDGQLGRIDKSTIPGKIMVIKDGKWVEEDDPKKSSKEIVVPGLGNDIEFKDFKVTAIDPKTAMVISKNPDNKYIKHYTSNEAHVLGEELKNVNTGLDKQDWADVSKIASVGQELSGLKPVAIRHYNEETDSIEDAVFMINEEDYINLKRGKVKPYEIAAKQDYGLRLSNLVQQSVFNQKDKLGITTQNW